MAEQMARSRASDTRDPANFPEDNGFRYCTECGNDIAVDLTNADEAEVDEFTNCYSHLKDIESLREECSRRDTSIHALTKDLREKDGIITELNKELSFQNGLVNDLHALLNESLLRFDRLNQLVQAYEKLLKG